MVPLTNVHTHTNFCDGAHSVDEMVRSAIEKGCPGIGFSSHPYVPYPPFDAMCRYDEMDYVYAVLDAREKYKNKIDVFLGLERDEVGLKPQYKGYDYFIGSAHGVLADGKYHPLDESGQETMNTVNNCFGGDFSRLAKEYYGNLCSVVEETKCQIVGHFDLITKFNEGGAMFDENDPQYVKVWTDALERIAKNHVIFEVNTGAISRGYRTQPYPSKEILRKMREMEIKIIITSDSHHKDTITYFFNEAGEYAKSCGYDKVMTLTKDGFIETRL